MDRFPKIVAKFNYTGNRNKLLNRLNGALLDSVRAEVLAFRSAAELAEKIKIVEFGDGRWEYYPKIVTTRPFTESEYTLLESAQARVIQTMQTTLAGEGATSIVIHSVPAPF